MIPILHKIQAAICAEFDVTSEELTSLARNAHIAEARHAMVLLTFEVTRLSMNSIGKTIGKDHGTIANSIQRATALISVDPNYHARFIRAKREVANNLRKE